MGPWGGGGQQAASVAGDFTSRRHRGFAPLRWNITDDAANYPQTVTINGTSVIACRSLAARRSHLERFVSAGQTGTVQLQPRGSGFKRDAGVACSGLAHGN